MLGVSVEKQNMEDAIQELQEEVTYKIDLPINLSTLHIFFNFRASLIWTLCSSAWWLHALCVREMRAR